MTDMTTCIYCGSAGDFTREHVFPAGMGGDDKNYILDNLVCANCNTKVFSPLEAALMRNSPWAIARLYEQPTGRKRGSKSKPTELDHKQCTVIQDDGRSVEAMLGEKGAPVTLPQVQINGDEVYVAADHGESLYSFLGELEALLIEEINFVEKRPEGEDAVFKVTRCHWDGHDYKVVEVALLGKPPVGFWIQDIDSNNSEFNWDRVFKRNRGQMVLRMHSHSDAEVFISTLKRTLPKLQAETETDNSITDKPLMHVGLSFSIEKIFRAIAKIGFNFACHEYGAHVVRSKAFDPVRESILHGSSPVRIQEADWLKQLMKADDRKAHVIILYPQIVKESYIVAFIMRLYGTSIQMIALAGDVIFSEPKEPVVFSIYYLEDRIERQTLTSYVHYLTQQLRSMDLEPELKSIGFPRH